MTKVEDEGRFVAPIDEVWSVVGDFVGFPEAMGLPVTVHGEGIGQTRTVTVAGDTIVERLEECDQEAHRLVYSIVSGPVPVVDYVATMELSALDTGGTALRWWGTFEPAPGGDEDAAIAFVSRIYRGAIRGLQGLFGAPDR